LHLQSPFFLRLGKKGKLNFHKFIQIKIPQNPVRDSKSPFNRLVDGSNLSRRTIYVNKKARPLWFSFFVFNRCIDDGRVAELQFLRFRALRQIKET
jgi:hypothetical protein